jgi:isoleucyl-tRNA synthetase
MESLKEEITWQRSSSDSAESEGSGDGSDTVRMTFHVDEETAERLRNAVYWTATPVTLSGTARDALKAAVRQLEEQYNDGEPFPDRDEELKGGNPNLKG